MSTFFKMVLIGICLLFSLGITFDLVEWIGKEIFGKNPRPFIGMAVWVIIFAIMGAIAW